MRLAGGGCTLVEHCLDTVLGKRLYVLAFRMRLGRRRPSHHSHIHRRHGVNVQVVTDPGGGLLGLSPALPGRTHDLTAARTHRVIRICERQGVPILADLAH
ncbi:DDE superfamily endonuclease [Streptomyces sp. PgraA7]|nr:DDE superfamily endonuclease [Streptomyces sp. PgraA7]